MDWLEVDTTNCSVAAASAIVGDRWSLLILRDAMNGVRRFDQFRQHLGISRTVLADRLDRMTELGIFERSEYRETGQRPRPEYRLTRKGWGLQKVLIALREWGDEFETPEDERLVELRDRSTGEPVELALVRRGDHHVVDPRDLVTVPGPGAARR